MNGNPIGYTNKDYTSLLAALQRVASQQMPEWTDQSPNDVGVMLLELFCAMGDALFYNMDRIAGESFLSTAVERRSVMNHLRLIGYELRAPLSASADLTLLFDPSTTGSVTISQFAAFKTMGVGDGRLSPSSTSLRRRSSSTAARCLTRSSTRPAPSRFYQQDKRRRRLKGRPPTAPIRPCRSSRSTPT